MNETVKQFATLLCNPSKDDRAKFIDLYIAIRANYDARQKDISSQFEKINLLRSQLAQNQQHDNLDCKTFQTFPSDKITSLTTEERGLLTQKFEQQKELETQISKIIQRTK
ncbi:hypothetical protein SS50377_27377 [Spironucleus salmonicida]|uniref:Uncharacterized protein n=1 Tax=Spironucleus salmonicida TaxID=348837 RepID=A0A9P8RVQ9_9EUKA|nr:hypothetical protein SS50377_27377 [Spironucleus salmonicida]